MIQMGDMKVQCRKVEEVLLSDPDIYEFYRITGSASYFIKAAVASVDELTALVDRLVPYGSVNTSIVLSSSGFFKPMLPPQS
ncbi:Lrp/AsnC ligand binding domain-containing protein [Paenibacillus sp. PR3]|uniref:Lrp/AsnC ligand binding domain-containing protein n=1 Tax=Paenibacillus terricola TaxID=2763503 RepID=A0ABR8MT22_9BACL|nr:Lrp/AsnC ligand binding domain-containing protein [Paenibacillus terricola]MBD3919068.1 Lrp/AsnC ligand binding domain-containing protein [Paenibacillus terricola]